MTASVFTLLPGSLLTCAYAVGSEYAWVAEHALAAIEAFQRLNVAILGIEIWIRRDAAPEIPTPWVYHWTCPVRGRHEEWNTFVVRACGAGSDYVRRFEWDAQDQDHAGIVPYFCITPSEAPLDPDLQ